MIPNNTKSGIISIIRFSGEKKPLYFFSGLPQPPISCRRVKFFRRSAAFALRVDNQTAPSPRFPVNASNFPASSVAFAVSVASACRLFPPR